MPVHREGTASLGRVDCEGSVDGFCFFIGERAGARIAHDDVGRASSPVVTTVRARPRHRVDEVERHAPSGGLVRSTAIIAGIEHDYFAGYNFTNLYTPLTSEIGWRTLLIP